MSKRSPSMTTFPFPSSPHCAPIIQLSLSFIIFIFTRHLSFHRALNDEKFNVKFKWSMFSSFFQHCVNRPIAETIAKIRPDGEFLKLASQRSGIARLSHFEFVYLNSVRFTSSKDIQSNAAARASRLCLRFRATSSPIRHLFFWSRL